MNDPWVIGGIVGAALAAGLFVARVVTVSGALAGGVLTCAFIGAGGWPVFSGFALLVLGGTIATRIARRRAGPSKDGDRRRDAWQALANAGPAVLLLLAIEDGGRVAALAALGAAWSDTASSELGQWKGGRPRILLFGRAVERGVDGGMSVGGTLIGLLAAGVAGGFAAWLGDPTWLLPVIVGAIAGNVVDSVLGASIEASLPRSAANHVVNALASAAGGLVGAWAHAGGWPS